MNFKIRLNAELILSNIDASTVSNTDSSSLSEIYDKFRILSKKDLEEMFQNSWSEISSNIDIKINNETKKINLIKTEVEDIKNFEISRDTHVYFRVLYIQAFYKLEKTFEISLIIENKASIKHLFYHFCNSLFL